MNDVATHLERRQAVALNPFAFRAWAVKRILRGQMCTEGESTMNEEGIAQLRVQVAATMDADKVTLEKRLKEEILQMRSYASFFEVKPTYFVCEGAHGRGVADKKEATIFNLLTKKPIRWVPFKSHLYAVHAVLCWSVLGISTNYW